MNDLNPADVKAALMFLIGACRRAKFDFGVEEMQTFLANLGQCTKLAQSIEVATPAPPAPEADSEGE